MAPRMAAQVIDELDPEDDDDIYQPEGQEQRAYAEDIPAGLGNNNRETPPARRQAEERSEPQFTVVETDDNGKPIGEPREVEGSLETEGFDPPPGQHAEGTRAPANRQTRSQRLQRQREKFARIEADNQDLRTQLTALSQTMGAIEPRISEMDQARRTSELREIERQIQHHKDAAAYARQRLKEAFSNQDPETFDSATEARDISIRAIDTLEGQHRALSQPQPLPRPNPQPQFQQQRPPPLPAAVMDRVHDFTAQHPWYNAANPRDIDSQIMLRIDEEVARDGFDPRTDDYWDEISARASKYLPHRFAAPQRQSLNRQQQLPAPRQQQQLPAPQRRGPMVGSGNGGSAPPASRTQVMMTPGRKDALIQNGVLSPDGRTIINHKRYDNSIRYFAAYDQEHGAPS